MNPSTEARLEAALPPDERRWLKWLRRAGAALLGLYFVLALGLLVVRFWVLPTIGAYKADIEAAASRALGEQVEIAEIEADWHGLHPRLAYPASACSTGAVLKRSSYPRLT